MRSYAPHATFQPTLPLRGATAKYGSRMINESSTGATLSDHIPPSLIMDIFYLFFWCEPLSSAMFTERSHRFKVVIRIKSPGRQTGTANAPLCTLRYRVTQCGAHSKSSLPGHARHRTSTPSHRARHKVKRSPFRPIHGNESSTLNRSRKPPESNPNRATNLSGNRTTHQQPHPPPPQILALF